MKIAIYVLAILKLKMLNHLKFQIPTAWRLKDLKAKLEHILNAQVQLIRGISKQRTLGFLKGSESIKSGYVRN